MIQKEKKICVLGLGYIGLPTASMFATHGHRVLGVDTNAHVISMLRKGQTHIEEPGLSTIVKAALSSKNLVVDHKCAPADVFIIAVPTPFKKSKAKIPPADLTFIKSAMQMLLPHLRKGNLVVLESTSPPSTTIDFIVPMIRKAGFKEGKDIGVAYCPERVIPGRTLEELVGNDRLIGAITPQWGEVAKELYKCFVSGDIYLTSPTVAEMVKLAENTYRDVNIALANELAVMCEDLGIDVWEVVKIANRHPRVQLHRPGPGVGGHCISVDPWFLAEQFPEKSELIQTARSINDRMPTHVVQKIDKLTAGIKRPRIAVLGLTYKGNVNDIRESPAIHIVHMLQKHRRRFDVRAYDPHVQLSEGTQRGLMEVFQDAHLAVILTAHDEFHALDPRKVGPLMNKRAILDTHSIISQEDWVAAGFHHYALGVGYK